MRCAWQSLLNLLPIRFRQSVDDTGRGALQELRLRCGSSPELVLPQGSIWLRETVTSEDISFVVNAASRYSPWAASTIRKGYVTAQGGHRVGLCGEAVIQGGEMTGIRNPVSLCIRVARDFENISIAAPNCGSMLIIGPPGSGKTTFLRDLIRTRSDAGTGSIAVVDERGELFPVCDQTLCFPAGRCTDIMTGCTKIRGIDAVLRTMGPKCIAFDEITAPEDCQALMNAGWCGVEFLATAHADNLDDLHARPIYRPLVNSGLFQWVILMQRDKSWRAERVCT